MSSIPEHVCALQAPDDSKIVTMYCVQKQVIFNKIDFNWITEMVDS